MKRKLLFFGTFVIFWIFGACSNEKAKLELTYSPAEAIIKIDGYSPASYKSPHIFEFYKPGLYNLEVSATGYVPVQMLVEVTSGDVTKQVIRLAESDPVSDPPNVIATTPTAPQEHATPDEPEPIAGEFSLTVNTAPPGATVTVQTNKMKSVLVLKTPATQVLGRYVPWHLNITHDGYEPVSQTIIAPDDKEEVVLDIALQKKSGPSGIASVTPPPPTPPPTQEIAVENNPPIPSDSVVRHGLLSVSTKPWTVVHINGKVIGNTPILNLKLAPGRYKILMENRELSKRKVQTVDIAPGGHVRLAQEL